MIKIKINNIDYNFRDGIIIKDELNETLDTGAIVIKNTEQDFETFDEIIITNEEVGFEKHMLIDVLKETTACFSPVKKLNYTITPISPTIKLQRIVLPNKTITQPLNAKRTILTELNKIVSVYAPDFIIDPEIQTILDETICPEKSWNRPTLYEVVNDLLSMVGMVVTVKRFNIISGLYLNKKGNEIDTSFLEDQESIQSANEYTNKFEVETVNAISDFMNVKTPGFISLRSEEAIMTTNNMKLFLEYPVYKIHKIRCKFKANYRLINTDPFTIKDLNLDIKNYIQEKPAYDILKTSNETYENGKDYKRNNIYYTLESNVIDGLTFTESTWVVNLDTNPAIKNVLERAFYATNISAPSPDINWNGASSNIRDLLFYVEYETINDVKFRSSKKFPNKHESILINNQTDSYISIDAFGKQQQQTVDRIGNKEKTIYGNYRNYNQIPNLGDTLGDYTLVSRQLQIYDNKIKMVGLLTKHYVMKNMFVGVDSKKRFTQIASGKDALLRNDITEYNFKLTFEENTNPSAIEQYLLNIGTVKYIVVETRGDYISTKLSHILIFEYEDGSFSNYYLLNSYINKVGLSLVTTIMAKDNYSIGKQINEPSFYGQRDIRYVDDNGEFKNIYIYFGAGQSYTENYLMTNSYDENLSYSKTLPIALLSTDPTDHILKQSKLRYKDNREIIAETIQFNYLSDNDIFIYDGFVNNCSFLIQARSTFSLYESDSDLYTENSNKILGNLSSNGTITISALYIEFANLKESTISCGVLDNNGNLVLGVNIEEGTTYFRLYLKEITQ